MLLSLAIFLPILTAIVVLCIPSRFGSVYKGVGVAGTLVTFAVTLLVTWNYREGAPNMRDAFKAERDGIVASLTEGPTKTAILAALENDTPATRKAVTDLGRAAVNQWSQLRELDLVLQPENLDARGEKRKNPAYEAAKHIQQVELAPWIPVFNINYLVGVDGLSLPLIFLTGLLGPLCLIYSWNIDKGAKAYFALFLLLEAGLIGVFLALDFFLFYVFWEIVLLPMYFLIGIWGGPRRIYAAIKFFIYTLAGSVLMLIAMLALYYASDPHTFNMLTLHALNAKFAASFQWWIFLGLFIGFAIKVPVFPFHTWLPDAHVEAPTAISVILAGVLLKMGAYGFFRLSYPLAPGVAAVSFTYLIAVLGLINLVYGALVAMAQTDFKKLVAYSSVSHMGYVLLGLAAFTHAGIQGAALQMFNHGVSSAMMFFLVGVVYERAHHRDLNRFGGLALKMPIYAGIATIGFFASLGLPGLNGFISEALVFMGMYQGDAWLRAVPGPAGGDHTWIIFASLLGIVFTAGYILWTLQRVFLGQPREAHAGGGDAHGGHGAAPAVAGGHDYPDLNWREYVALVPLAILCIVVGVYPNSVLWCMDATLTTLVDTVRAAVPR